MLIFFVFFLRALGNPATAAWGEQSPAGRQHVAARREEEEEHVPASHQVNLQPVHHEQLELPPRGRDLTQRHPTWPAGLVWGQTFCLRPLVELRVCLRHLFARKFGQQKAEGGGVLLNGFLSVETPWRTVWCARAWAKVPRGGIKPHLAKLSPSASSMHLLLFFPEIVLSQVRNTVGITMRAESTKFSLQPESFTSHILPCC